MTTHTPGPWTAVCDPERDPQHMAMVKTIVNTICIDCTRSGRNYAEDCANARLIAAAPDLLAALREIERWLADGLPLGKNQKAALAGKARGAIAKAEER